MNNWLKAATSVLRCMGLFWLLATMFVFFTGSVYSPLATVIWFAAGIHAGLFGYIGAGERICGSDNWSWSAGDDLAIANRIVATLLGSMLLWNGTRRRAAGLVPGGGRAGRGDQGAITRDDGHVIRQD